MRRRLVAGVGLALVVVLALGAIGRWVWWPHYRPALRDGERYGVDVSHHQGDIDWVAVAGDDVDFAYIKATQGSDFADPLFARNWDDAGAAGLDRGAYHFFSLCRPGAEQARHFLDALPDDPDALPPVVDLELAGNCPDRPLRAEVRREVLAFLDEVEAATGQEVVLYVGADLEGRYDLRDGLDRPIWHRRLLLRPDVDGWWMWQFHDRAEVDGIDGGVDLDVMRGDAP